ncbi:thymidine phosphorylase [Skeletonema marinoi]|uniref:Thymidine phosphorylase n=1 Tax=Skeletonema marinoi TaxID=267567 RepID=A0AAD8Y7K7_9STRA|nr:thymidine phosphorylase [Skeletonema marinoi]
MASSSPSKASSSSTAAGASTSVGHVKDYQMTAWLMAICLNGMNGVETAALCDAMVDSGEVMDWSAALHLQRCEQLTQGRQTQHGGVGDKVSLILAPLVASFDLVVPMMAGRGLGHTGDRSDDRRLNAAIVSPSKDMVPADKRMYALRDVTSTVSCLPLQISSIMSKKIAERPDSLFRRQIWPWKNVEESLQLASGMIETGELCGINTTALVTRMDSPLGYAVGNWLEVKECIEIMSSKEAALSELSADLVNVTLALAAQMLVQGGKAGNLRDGIVKAKENLLNGKAWDKFREMVSAQGGDVDTIDFPEQYAQAQFSAEVISSQSGYLVSINALEVGLVGVNIGAGRKTVDDPIDKTAGILFHKRPGMHVVEGDVLATVYTERGDQLANAVQRILDSCTFSDDQIELPPLITNFVTNEGVEDFDQSIFGE